MSVLVFIILSFAALCVLALRGAALPYWAAVIAVLTLIGQVGVPFLAPAWSAWSVPTLAGWLIAAGLAALSLPGLQHRFVIRPAYRALKRVMPTVSDTEKEALEAGTVGWDAELFSGDPDWSKLKSVAPISLTEEERAFLDGPTEELCRSLDDWEIRQERREIPDKIWSLVAEKGFLGMLISKEHGGLGFSPQAQSLILGKIASRSPDAVTIVMVPNSLGPGELIEKYGTSVQKEHYLPRLAKGQEIPCFGLTGPTSGSDAAAMRDVGIVCEGQHKGKKTLGIRLTWDKRYISLGPKATLLGLAFRLYDPDGLLDKGEDVG
ncbi:MAG: acyl-CoA dehydrogenase family protein, partial [Methyloligellaceae bacterium]